jgi:hypothetical protein
MLFPGFDPFLEHEEYWPAFHQHMMKAVYLQLSQRYDAEFRLNLNSRVFTTEMVLFTSVTREVHNEPVLELRDKTTGQLMYCIDLASVKNCTTEVGFQALCATRDQALAQGAGYVIISLVTQGRRVYPTEVERNRQLKRRSYVVQVRFPRVTGQHQYLAYLSSVRHQLPTIKFSHESADERLELDLQEAYLHASMNLQNLPAAVYQKGLPKDVIYSDDDREWINDRISGTTWDG